MTLAISWGSITTVVVPWGTAALAYWAGGEINLRFGFVAPKPHNPIAANGNISLAEATGENVDNLASFQEKIRFLPAHGRISPLFEIFYLGSRRFSHDSLVDRLSFLIRVSSRYQQEVARFVSQCSRKCPSGTRVPRVLGNSSSKKKLTRTVDFVKKGTKSSIQSGEKHGGDRQK